MKKYISFFLVLLVFTSYSCNSQPLVSVEPGNPADSTSVTKPDSPQNELEDGQYQDSRTGIPIYFDIPGQLFPEFWLEEPINGKGYPVEENEIDRCKKASKISLDKYHEDILKWNLKKLFWVKSLEFYGVAYGGTNSNENLYLVNDGKSEGYDDHYLEGSFHHEFSSILWRNYEAYFSKEKWKTLNPEGFSYGDGGANAIAEGEASEEFSIKYNSQGFLNEYSQSSMENDVNEIAQNLFSPDEGFWEAVNTHQALKLKVDFVIDFYQQIWEGFSREVFKSYAD